MNRVGIGVIGIGSFGKLHAKTFAELDSANLIAISSRNTTEVKPFAEKLGAKLYSDYNDLLADMSIQAVSICVPPYIQAEIAVKALEAGKYVLLEKPIATTLEDASLIIETAKKCNRTVMVGYIERFNPSLRRVKSLVQNGQIGELFKVSSRRASRFEGKPDWVWDKCGMMVHICGHDLDIIRWLFEDEIERVYAESGSFLRQVEGQPDNICILMRFKNGGIGVIESSWTLPSTFPTEENDTRIDLLGTSGNMIVNNLEQTIAMCTEQKGWYLPGILRWPGGINEDVGLISYAMRDELDHFVKCIQGKKNPIVSPEDAKKTLEILLAANESIKQQKPILFEKR